MKICMIVGGKLPLPPQGWGGVEATVWNYMKELKSRGHEVLITNTGNLKKVIETVNDWQPDFVHLQYDVWADIMPHINSPVKAMTSHYPYLDYPSKRKDYEWIFHKFCKNHSHIFTLSELNSTHFRSFGAKNSLLWTWKFGVDSKKFKFSNKVLFSDKTISLGKIEPRKRQAHLQNLKADIDFVGPVVDSRFNQEDSSYLGKWTREEVYENLTNYPNLILFSDGEAAPQVTAEALVAGCGLVVSKEAIANLDTSLPFISVVDENINQKDLINIVKENRINSIKYRSEIREYGIETFDLKNCVSRYIEKIKQLKDYHDSI